MNNKLNKQEFDEVFKLMQKSFPESEYYNYEKQLGLMDEDEYTIHTKFDENGNLMAFVALWNFPNFVFIEHLAVNPDCRGAGIGTKVMEEIIKKYAKPIVLEIEPPQNDITTKRCRFYERLGFYICNFEYYQPPLRAGQKKLRLNLMNNSHPLSKDEFDSIKNCLYQKVYKVVL